MTKEIFSYLMAASIFLLTQMRCDAQNPDSTLVVKKTADFQVTGDGTSSAWGSTKWLDITVQKSSGKTFGTKAKMLYSDTGVYFLFDCEDRKLTATIMEDFGALYKEDVVEVFMQPDTTLPIYLEYEISPLDYELAILVPNINGKFQGWRPWFYEKNKVQHATSASGGQKKSMASVEGWKAEFFIPYSLMNPVVQQIPVSGTKWKGNFYRIDYDKDYTTWSWKKTSGSFHEYKKFGTIIFE